MGISFYNNETEQRETMANGRVLRVYSDTIQIMSDVWANAGYAVYWDDATDSVKTMTLWIDDMGLQAAKDGKINSAVVDADMVTVEKYRESVFETFREMTISSEKKALAVIKKGDMVRVARGRNSKGAEGKVFWTGYGMYKAGPYNAKNEARYGIALDDEMTWVRGKNGELYETNKNVAWVWARNVDLLTERKVDMDEVNKIATIRTDSRMKNEGLM